MKIKNKYFNSIYLKKNQSPGIKLLVSFIISTFNYLQKKKNIKVLKYIYLFKFYNYFNFTVINRNTICKKINLTKFNFVFTIV